MGYQLLRRYLNWNSIFSHALVNLSYSFSQFSAPIAFMEAIGVENREQNNGHCYLLLFSSLPSFVPDLVPGTLYPNKLS